MVSVYLEGEDLTVYVFHFHSTRMGQGEKTVSAWASSSDYNQVIEMRTWKTENGRKH